MPALCAHQPEASQPEARFPDTGRRSGRDRSRSNRKVGYADDEIRLGTSIRSERSRCNSQAVTC
jgi:hypothetical protein